MKKWKVAICQFPGNGWIRKEQGWWLSRTLHEMKKDPRISEILDVTLSDTPITMSRNRAVRECLAADVDYILMIDSDMEPDYEVGRRKEARPFWTTAWNWMLNRRHEELAYLELLGGEKKLDESKTQEMFKEFPPATIAAPYCGPPPHENCYIFHWETFATSEPDAKFKLSMIEREDAAKRMGIERVAALPTGLILYDSRVFRYLEDAEELPWFEYEYEDKYNTIKATTEDVYQTRNASLLGMPQFVCWDCWAKHWKDKGVEKPFVLNCDGIRQAYANAVKKDFKVNKYLKFVSRHDVEPISESNGHAEEPMVENLLKDIFRRDEARELPTH